MAQPPLMNVDELLETKLSSFLRNEPNGRTREECQGAPCSEQLPAAATTLENGKRSTFVTDETDAAVSFRRQSVARKSLRLVLLNNGTKPLPKDLLNGVLSVDPRAQMRSRWTSITNMLATHSCIAPDAIVAVSDNFDVVMRQIEETWHLRVQHNYSPRPIYFAISRDRQPATVRFDVERLGGHFLCFCDVATHFQAELEQIRLELAPVMRSLPSWLIVQEGNGTTLRAVVNLVSRRKSVRVPGSDRLIAALAAFIKHNGIPRSLSAWQKVLADDSLFKPAGGGFALPSISTLKMYLHRGFRNCLQRTFNAYRSGFCADCVIERINPGSHGAQYRIRGEWQIVRR